MKHDPDVLIVDDDEDVREAIQAILEGNGYVARVASDGPQALAMLHAAPPSLVLLDLMMPTMSGGEVIRRIREDAELRAIPIVVISALGREAVQVPGTQGVLQKPFDSESLLATTERFVR